MPAVVQMLRTTSATALPASLVAGQIAVNLANGWLMVGDGGGDITVDGAALAYGGASVAPVLGINGVVVPAKPAAGGGYGIYDLNTPVIPTAHVLSITDNLVDGAAGATTSAKVVAALIARGDITSGADLTMGDTVIITAGAGSPFAGIDLGSYIWDGSVWALNGGTTPDASNTVAGAVTLALDTAVLPATDATATTPAATDVATAAQLKAANTVIGGLVGATALLGTYDASASQVDAVGPSASVGGRTGIAAGAAIAAGGGFKAGDKFVVSTSGTVAGTEPGGLGGSAMVVGDIIMYDGANWTLLSTGTVVGGVTVHGATDVSDTNVATVAPGDVKGILVRDGTVADGLANAYKLVSVVDLGTF